MDIVVFEIFSHLPAKSIFKFRIVSKQCHENSSLVLLAFKQCKNLESKEDLCFIIQPKNCEKVSPTNLQLNFLCETSKPFCGFPPPSLEFLSTTGSILASSNGLLCCKNIGKAEYPIFLCNPVTKTWLPIIKPTSYFNIDQYQFSFVLACNVDHNREDDYILMYAGPRPDVWDTSINLCKIYSPRKKAWEESGEMVVGSRSIDFGSPAYLKNDGGTIYFMSDWNEYLTITKNRPFYWPYIVSYNIRNSISKFLKIPKPARKGVFKDHSSMFGVFKFKDPTTCRESICLIKLMKLVFSVWMLTDINSSTWKLIMKSRSKAMGLYEYLKPTISGFTVINGNLLLIATADQLYGYTLTGDLMKSSNVKRAVKIGWHGCGRDDVSFYSYSNTLRPCGDGAVPLPLK
ncbi:F-box domain-containing protein [Heracleum sosnowskyi]|uniref:F-box domain-containing protein n=1 Tax=Heracleum sosnowskyi TaxID=360622 RepID=A0AAD8MXK8_9APIA|nr:F-box domain-containing protein [Heracleum sosnowskyi]